MNALTQYLELYRQHAEQFRQGFPESINRAREQALRLLERPGTRLPGKGDEGYEMTSVNDMYAPDLGVNVMRRNIPVDVAHTFRCAVPSITANIAVVVNDAFRPVSSPEGGLPEGVTFMSLRRAAELYPDEVSRFYGRIADENDPAVALNTLMMQDGVFIHIARGVRLERPLQVVNIFSSPTPLMAVRRMLVVMEEGSAMDLLVCDHTQDDSGQYLSSQVTEIALMADASLGLYGIEETSSRTSAHRMTYVRQEGGSRLDTVDASLTSGTSRNDITVDLRGEHAETALAGMVIADRGMHVDFSTRVNHHVPGCKSNQLYKYVVDDEAVGAFEGSILVADGARLTEAFQTNRNILMSRHGKMHSKPRLEIYNDDVRCSHGATTGQIDENALFYMQTRGIPADTARRMLMQAFMVDIVDAVRPESLRDRLHMLVDRRFSGEAPSCHTGGCRTSCRH